MTRSVARADVAVIAAGPLVGVGYVLDGAPYYLCLPAPPGSDSSGVGGLVARHAQALGYAAAELSAVGEARPLARLALALRRVANGELPGDAEREQLRAVQPGGGPVTLHADGSYDRRDAQLSAGYTLNGRPYALSFPVSGPLNGALAEREAIRVALTHASLLGFSDYRVRSDHLFHVRRYAEDLIHRGRRQSASLERLDALVAGLGAQVRFEYAPTEGHQAPHRMAVHARAVQRLAGQLALSNVQRAALRRVHYALRSPVPVPF